jgi:glycosyl transferase family 25
MQVYLISSSFLASGRYQFQQEQLASLGLEYVLIDPVTPVSLSIPVRHPYWQRWQRPLRPVECAILQSHQIAWRAIANSLLPSLVIEDDIILSKHAPGLLDCLSQHVNARMVILETRGRKKLFSRKAELQPSLRLLYENRCGAAAYVLWPATAQHLLRMTASRGLLADAALGSLKGNGVYQVIPPLAFQADCCDRYGFIAPFSLCSSVLSVSRPRPDEYSCWLRFCWIVRRIFSQASIAFTFVAHGLRSVYLEPMPRPEDFR